LNPIYKKWPGTGALLLGLNSALLILALIWWPLRMLYADSAFMSWRLFQYGQMDFGHLRYSAVLTQFSPWLSVHAGLDLHALLVVYSISLQLPVFILALYAFKRNLHGTALACFMLCSVWTASAWFVPVSEMYLAAVFALGWHAVYSKQGSPYLAALLFVLSAGSHSGILPALLFMATHQALSEPFQRWWPLAGGLILLAILKLWSQDTYEQGFLLHLLHPERLPEAYIPSYLWRTALHGSGAALLLLSGSAIWLYRKQPMKMLWHGIAGLFLFTLLALLFWEGDSDQVLEKNLIPLFLFLSLPMMEAANTAGHQRQYGMLMAAIVLFGAYQLTLAQQWSLNRHKQLRSLVAFANKACPSGKIAITGAPGQMDRRLHASWALPYETLMCSRIFQAGKTMVSVKLMREEQPDSSYRDALFSGAVFERSLPVSALHAKGYNLSPAPYCILDIQQCRW